MHLWHAACARACVCVCIFPLAQSNPTFRAPAPLHPLQSRMSEVFGVDIHPAARLGWGVMMDHATGEAQGDGGMRGGGMHEGGKSSCHTAPSGWLYWPPAACSTCCPADADLLGLEGVCAWLHAPAPPPPAHPCPPSMYPAPRCRHSDRRDSDSGRQRQHAAPRHPGRQRHWQGRAAPCGRQWGAAGGGR